MKRPAPTILLACLISGLSPAILWAQCADGTPPPCAVRAQPTAIRTAPSSEAARGRSFLVLPFRNVTGSPDHEWLVEGSVTLLADALSQWQEISVVPAERLAPALRRNGLEPGAVMEEDRVRRVAEETGGWTVVAGDVVATGSRVRLMARAYDVVTGRDLVRAVHQVDADADILSAYEELAGQLLEAAGLEAQTPDLAAATTQSLDAYKAYVRGIGHFNRSEYRGARAAFLEATELDDSFAQAYAGLAMASAKDIAIIMNPFNPATRYAQRAVELSGSLPPRERTLVRAISGILLGQFTDARAGLEQLLELDSADLDAMEWLAMLEMMDWLLVPSDGGERVRGSFNRAARLAKSVLGLDPARHQAYGTLTLIYAWAGGLWVGGEIPTHRREFSSLAATLMAPPDQVFHAMMRDTLELVPDSIMQLIPRERAAAQQRARGVARDWAERWVAAGPTEAEAHLAASTVYELDGQYDLALEYLERADSLGIESEIEHLDSRRISMLVKLGRFDAALPVADSVLATGYFGTPMADTPFNFRGAVWAAQLYLLTGRLDDAAAAVQAWGRPDRACGLTTTGPSWEVRVPATLRPAIADRALSLIDVWPERPDLRDCVFELALGVVRRAEGEERAQLLDSLLFAWERMADVLPEGDRALAVFQQGQLGAYTGRQEVVQHALDELIDGGALESAARLAAQVIQIDTTVVGRMAVLERLVRITEVDPMVLRAVYQIGKIGALTGLELDLAQGSLEEYLRHPAVPGLSHAAAHWRLGMIHEHRGDVDRARAAYEESLRLDPDYAVSRAALERLAGRRPVR